MVSSPLHGVEASPAPGAEATQKTMYSSPWKNSQVLVRVHNSGVRTLPQTCPTLNLLRRLNQQSGRPQSTGAYLVLPAIIFLFVEGTNGVICEMSLCPVVPIVVEPY